MLRCSGRPVYLRAAGLLLLLRRLVYQSHSARRICDDMAVRVIYCTCAAGLSLSGAPLLAHCGSPVMAQASRVGTISQRTRSSRVSLRTISSACPSFTITIAGLVKRL
jgi:hypothetical protein